MHCCLAGLPVADDQFALAATDRDQGLEAEADIGSMHGFRPNDAGRLDVDTAAFVRS